MQSIEGFVYDKLMESGHYNVAALIGAEDSRQKNVVELIASENFPSEAVRAAAASGLVAKYSEGYPAKRTSGNAGRYYGGCKYVDELEEYCCDLWRQLFDINYHVNVQPRSGSSANLAAYMALTYRPDGEKGDHYEIPDLGPGPAGQRLLAA